ncbi:hypothetical protein H072_1826 [Dactylellina haptotyla CBS 200.50]|uniref:F-box domain-containing protein n=1 Tax=Dactylellina haptotyla (strain CBS 200.50) TaxID=1284197 RepID=S8C927_DACHA|nr:hypothetical protein H072_1826 [Dactylellina haptotyla CBS 200.50]
MSVILALPVELQSQILNWLPLIDQIHASKVCGRWRDLILHSKSFLKSRYSNVNMMLGVHHIICLESKCFSCTVRGQGTREYYFLGERIDEPFMDEPLFAPWAWNDEHAKGRLSTLEVDMFTAVPGAYRHTWTGYSEFGQTVTVREFIEKVLKPVLDTANEPPLENAKVRDLEGTLTFFIGLQVLAAAFTLTGG